MAKPVRPSLAMKRSKAGAHLGPGNSAVVNTLPMLMMTLRKNRVGDQDDTGDDNLGSVVALLFCITTLLLRRYHSSAVVLRRCKRPFGSVYKNLSPKSDWTLTTLNP